MLIEVFCPSSTLRVRNISSQPKGREKNLVLKKSAPVDCLRPPDSQDNEQERNEYKRVSHLSLGTNEGDDGVTLDT